MAHAFNPSTWEEEAGGFVSSRTPLATHTKRHTKKKKKKKKKKKPKKINKV